MATLEQIFHRLTEEVRKASHEVFFSEGDDEVELHRSSDLILYTDSQTREKIALEFVLFDEELYLTSDGSISLLAKDSDDPLLLDDPYIIRIIGQFLAWRTKTIIQIGI